MIVDRVIMVQRAYQCEVSPVACTAIGERQLVQRLLVEQRLQRVIH
jgi:hypothetical protein